MSLVTKAEEVKKAIAQAEEDFGSIDVFVANAGNNLSI
jgi:NADP-dependent 3-hydroxy acid dehydrogenase YdfG